ncbi:MAG: hypothetical protein LIO85_00675 [Rikenellaceae bacterium]|nr:hypothetical protein [Rikenellaceae bacterium]MCC8174244.1 hypothetical protein [Odoribacter sp.]
MHDQSNLGGDLLKAIVDIILVEDLNNEKTDREDLPISEFKRISRYEELRGKYKRVKLLLFSYGLTPEAHAEFPVKAFCEGLFIPPRLLETERDIAYLVDEAEEIGIRESLEKIMLEDPSAKNRREYSFIVRDYYLSLMNFYLPTLQLLQNWLTSPERYKGYNLGIEFIDDRLCNLKYMSIIKETETILVNIINRYIKPFAPGCNPEEDRVRTGDKLMDYFLSIL